MASHREDRVHLVQDAYSLRCAPQVTGAARDAVAYAAVVAERELAPVIDNPVITLDNRIESNGNFHGAPVAHALDFLAIPVADVASISERRTDRTLDRTRNQGLPPFLAHEVGVDSGYMIAQYTAAGIVSTLKRLAVPASVDSIPSSAMQEDHVSMGWHAGVKLGRAVTGLRQVLAIELLTAGRALDLRAPLTPAPGTGAALAALREQVAGPGPDGYVADEIGAAVGVIESGRLLPAVQRRGRRHWPECACRTGAHLPARRPGRRDLLPPTPRRNGRLRRLRPGPPRRNGRLRRLRATRHARNGRKPPQPSLATPPARTPTPQRSLATPPGNTPRPKQSQTTATVACDAPARPPRRNGRLRRLRATRRARNSRKPPQPSLATPARGLTPPHTHRHPASQTDNAAGPVRSEHSADRRPGHGLDSHDDVWSGHGTRPRHPDRRARTSGHVPVSGRMGAGGRHPDALQQPRPRGGRAPGRAGRLRRHRPGRPGLAQLPRADPHADDPARRRDDAGAVRPARRRDAHPRVGAARADRQLATWSGTGPRGRSSAGSRHSA